MGDVHYHSSEIPNLISSRFSRTLDPANSLTYNLGLGLDGAPMIDEDAFVGREAELAQLKEWLAYAPSKQNIVAVYGLGGIGKTHLSIHFAKLNREQYSSIIWLNAKDENSLKAGLVALVSRILSQTEREAY